MKICPKCNGPLGDRPALSRRDNKTDICSECGYKEAMEDAEKLMNRMRKENNNGN
jgi:DNA-directed RNA polymerase subunit M/transcription elongation factor TFIIS|nr:MAG TPA: DNA-directed RNA polymerase [Caudoviricetes sp.]